MGAFWLRLVDEIAERVMEMLSTTRRVEKSVRTHAPCHAVAVEMVKSAFDLVHRRPERGKRVSVRLCTRRTRISDVNVRGHRVDDALVAFSKPYFGLETVDFGKLVCVRHCGELKWRVKEELEEEEFGGGTATPAR